MRIGLDIDNVISAFDEDIYKYMLLEDKKKRGAGIINPNADYITHGMLDWSREEIKDFFAENMENIAKGLRTRKGCREQINNLIEDGHEIILISNRVFPDYKNPEKTTLEWLKKRKINFHKLVLSSTPDKSNECIENKIDIMVDDRVSQCKIMREKGINCITMLTKYNKNEVENPYAKSWVDLYRKITEWKK